MIRILEVLFRMFARFIRFISTLFSFMPINKHKHTVVENNMKKKQTQEILTHSLTGIWNGRKFKEPGNYNKENELNTGNQVTVYSWTKPPAA